MLAKGRSQADMMTVGRALAQGKLAAARRRAKYARQVWAVFQGPPCHHVCLTPTVLAARQYNSLNHNVGCRWLHPKYPTPSMLYAAVEIQNPHGIRGYILTLLKGELHKWKK